MMNYFYAPFFKILEEKKGAANNLEKMEKGKVMGSDDVFLFNGKVYRFA